MNSPPLNPSQHVERIREILIGRDLQQMHGRISRIEGTLQQEGAPVMASPDLHAAITSLRNEQTALRQEIQNFKNHPSSALSSSFSGLGSAAPDDPTSELTARIDAQFREILSHLQNELLQLKGQLDEDLQKLREAKADRSELQNRFHRLANAAMEDQNTNQTGDNSIL